MLCEIPWGSPSPPPRQAGLLTHCTWKCEKSWLLQGQTLPTALPLGLTARPLGSPTPNSEDRGPQPPFPAPAWAWLTPVPDPSLCAVFGDHLQVSDPRASSGSRVQCRAPVCPPQQRANGRIFHTLSSPGIRGSLPASRFPGRYTETPQALRAHCLDSPPGLGRRSRVGRVGTWPPET